MIAKEWRDARWKLLLAVVVFLVLIPTVRSYEAIRDDVEFEIRMTQREIQRPEKSMGPMGEQEREAYITDMRRSVQEMQSPEYVEEMARWELRDTSTFRNLLVIVPLAGLLGIGLVAGEVSRGSIYLLLSKPVGRTRMLTTKYAVGALCLLVATAIGGASIILVAYARGYPPDSVEVSKILSATVFTYLGSLFVLGVALIASVILRDVLRTLLATVVAMFVILTGPDLFRAFVEWIIWGDRIYMMNSRQLPQWYETIEHLRLFHYWTGAQTYFGAPSEITAVRSLVVCVVTATAAFMLALWMFRRKAL